MILFETVRGNVVAAVGDEADDGTVGMREIGVVGDGLIDVDVGVIAVNNEAGRGRVVIVGVNGVLETDVCDLIVSILFGVVGVCCG